MEEIHPKGRICIEDEELQNLHSLSNTIRMIKFKKMRYTGSVARIGEMRNSYKTSIRKREGKKPLGVPRRRWEVSIKMHLKEVGVRISLDLSGSG
jgi:hypothetical protein